MIKYKFWYFYRDNKLFPIKNKIKNTGGRFYCLLEAIESSPRVFYAVVSILSIACLSSSGIGTALTLGVLKSAQARIS